MSTDNHAFVMGIRAKMNGQTWGTNPFSPDAEPVRFEMWLDGWADEQDSQAAFS